MSKVKMTEDLKKVYPKDTTVSNKRGFWWGFYTTKNGIVEFMIDSKENTTKLEFAFNGINHTRTYNKAYANKGLAQKANQLTRRVYAEWQNYIFNSSIKTIEDTELPVNITFGYYFTPTHKIDSFFSKLVVVYSVFAVGILI